MTRKAQILDVLLHCDSTSGAIARITGMPRKTASSKLCELHSMGVVTRERVAYDQTGHPPYLYSIKTGRGA